MATCVVLVLLLQLASHALGQSNELPYFDEEEITVHVYEDHNKSMPILASSHQATDPEGDPITYFIPALGLGSDSFYLVNLVDGFNIYFMDSVTIDRETKDEYRVAVTAEDNIDHGDVEPSMLTIVIEIEDINDEIPEINNLPETVQFSEDIDLNTLIYDVDATDDDIGKNSQIRYKISSVTPFDGEDKFLIFVSSGEIKLKNKLDYENTTEYKISVIAEDRGDPPLSSLEILTVEVLDANDNDPKFNQVQYSKQIYESLSDGSPVLQVEAVDQDVMLDYDIVYSIDNISPSGSLFTIDNSTGVIYVNGKLDADFGSPQVYTLTIRGEEEPDPDKFATTTAIITILDINDHPPEFEQMSYNGTLAESSHIGTTVLTVKASDEDQGSNAQFTFHLVNLLSTPLPFNITQSSDGESGYIQTTDDLDFETTKNYKFEVIATEVVDNRTKTASTVVTVTVTNINDNFPQFEKTEYFANISEIANINAFVGKVSAEDDDEGTFGVVHYYLINYQDVFDIEPTLGTITLKQTLDYEITMSYALTVAANDSATPQSAQLKSQVQVHVSVLDANDNGPVITVNGSQAIDEVTKKLEEEQEAGVLVYVIEADDIDDPPNDNLEYFVEVLEPRNLSSTHFQYSDIASNQLITSVPLNYEEVKQYKLKACVTDVGSLLNEVIGSGSGFEIQYETVNDLPPSHVDCIEIIVNVIDENDNRPVFDGGIESYSFSVYEEQLANTFVGDANATDKDSGQFGTVRYSISGVDHENFTIDPVTGEIFTSGPIDREEKDRFDLIVTAYDLDPDNPLSATATLTITILDINDNVPKFFQPIYVENDIVENSNIVSIKVSATDEDIGVNSDITYTIVDGNSDNQFIINPTTGEIGRNTAVTLDREANPEFELIIEAKDAGTPNSLSSNATVIIELQDENDEKPIFEKDIYYVNVTEGTSIESQILIVKADDPDDGPNGVVRYSIVSGTDSLYFSVASMTGVITTNKDFDYDTEKSTYTFDIIAIDSGVMPKSSEATVEVTILDINDNPPMFTKVQYSKSVYENINGGEYITTVEATDEDDGSNKIITYSITNVATTGTIVPTEAMADDTNGLFTLNNKTGQLYLSNGRVFDYESVKGYTVQVEAKDGGALPLTDISIVQVTILDFNDNHPVLSDESYSLVIEEDEEVKSTFDIFSYTDEDSGDNAEASYSINTNVFSIDPKTGILTLELSLNYETMDYFEFEVTVTDGGSPQLADTSIVNVTVVDSNDNNPVFKMPPAPSYSTSIDLIERNYTNMLLYTFFAEDADDDLNGEVEYTITVGDVSLFEVDPDNGEFKVVGNIDREIEDYYELTITATDGGVPSRSATATIIINVLDANEEPPYFLSDSYSYTIVENNAKNITLVTVEAEDQDAGANSDITFSINDTANFMITSDGEIKASIAFDHEEMQSVNVLVTATDGGGLYSTVIFTLIVTDDNDNSPDFGITNNTFAITENVLVGYHLTSSKATDEDSGANGDVTYQLSGAQGKFAIDTNGQITLQSSLDRETTEYYYLVVTAFDHGFSPRSATNEINVTVIDVNDNSPVFEPNYYNIEVPENESVSNVLVSVSASDKDAGANAELMFAIVDGNTGNTFSINNTVYNALNSKYIGSIVLESALDYETKTSYSLQVTAADMGTPVMSSTAFVSINIQNINDEQPVFSPSDSYVFSISEIAIVNTPVGTVYATDDDIGTFGDISSYTFAPNTNSNVTSTFALSETNGVITLSDASNLDYDSNSKIYSFDVVATDGGGLGSTASVVVNVLPHNEDAPEFESQSYTGSVLENQPMNQLITTVKATDPDNSPITYSITEGDDDGDFNVDSSGNIRTTKPLDREDKEVYVLRVRASDGALFGFTQVEITVSDENDNYPKFPDTITVYDISENSLQNIVLTPKVIATDEDKGNNSLITYTASGEGVPNVFSVDSVTGDIKLVDTLNFESKPKYVFHVFAEDGGVDSKSSNITIEVNVLDFNDNSPMFEKSSYAESVSESLAQGSVVAVVFANDSDSGSNAEISYSIEGSDKFEINSIGEILSKEKLDYETDTDFSLIVVATDNGNPVKSASVTVDLTILDTNDESPMFDQSSYSFEIMEQDVLSDVFLLAIVATDNDGTSPNNKVSYNITNGDNDMKFKIDADGNLYAVKDLDFEEEQEYILTVTAMDNPVNDSDRRYNKTEVTITIQDVNDNSPVWDLSSKYNTAPNQFAGNIIESAVADTLVVFVEATDEDSGAFGTVTYSFLSPSDKFYINETSGFVYTFGGLDVETVDFYNLTIVATDGGSKSTIGYLNIEVIDINDREPSFISSFFYKEVKEDVDESFSLITLTAFDIDSEDLVYSIIDGNNDGFFKINSSTGEVGLAKNLDRETDDDILLTVFVSDGLFNDTTNLRVVITDVNDNAPKFIDAPYIAYIDENTVSGAVLLYNTNGNTTRVLAVDADQPETANSIVVYEMIGVNADVLNIGPSTGVLTVASGANLDFEKETVVVVTVLAQDSVDPPGVMSSSTTITINVLDVNDNSPKFRKNSYSSAVEENKPASTVVVEAGDIEARDNDTIGGPITYSIVNSNPSANLDDFIINSTTAEVTLANELDREETHEITLTVRATDGGPSVFMTAEVLLTVSVLDVNDNNPVFNASSYFKSVPENIGAGASITTVLATDEDDNKNGNVQYSLLTFEDVFLINEDTGAITTIINLDHEERDQYSILVQACDKGDQSLCSNGTVSVQVTDINDLAPEFDYDIYHTTICNDATPVTDVLQVIALDGDSGDNGKVRYTLASGSDLGTLFTLDKDDGQIKLVENIPVDSIDTTLTVNILATDGGSIPKTGQTEVQISFCNKNTANIYFNQSLYYGAVTENEVPPIHVTTVTAISSNLPITYSVLPPKTTSYFNITQDGEINTTLMLDREERMTYTLIVEAVDSAPSPNTAYSTISVTILDVNDNPPKFLLPPYSFVLTEELTSVTVIDTVVAIDPDQPFDPYGVTYSIDSASNPDGVFSIDANGTIYANEPVDRENTPQFTLKIKATDTDASDPRITTATATITVLDINDNAPMFDPPSYAEAFSENHPPNFSILKVSATDSDIDLNREIVYSIESGGEDKFFIDSSTGVLKTLTQLDYEEDQFFNITIKAQDKGAPPQSSFTYVAITVEDYNDCTPMFTNSSYETVLKEDQELGPVLDIFAKDCDSGENKKITYTIVAGNSDNKFGLNSTSGELFLKNSLDYETETSYIIQIRAEDGGSPSLSDLTQVYIAVTDVNDKDPMFGQSTYVLTLPEDRNVGFEIIVVSATDEDASDENSGLIYSIVSGDDNGDFIIDPNTGSIKVDKDLDRETTPSYFIELGVVDTGAVPRSANATLSITITDVNDNAPIISNLPDGFSVNVLENASMHEALFVVNASDKDINENALLEFSLQNYEKVFSINPSTGEIRLITTLDYDESDREYQLSIEVTDLAVDEFSRMIDQATLNILVQDINDNDPIFVEDQYVVSRPEEENPGQAFTTVEATDLDGTEANNKITYQIRSCSPSPLCLTKFAVGNSTGVVTNLEKLDREEDDSFTLMIEGVNLGAYPKRSDTTTVMITITDVNDHAPQFVEDMYSTAIFEGTMPNTPLFYFNATDQDQPNTINSQLSYKIASVIPNSPFSLNEDSGLLEVTGTIDRELVSFYNFTVRVEDSGETVLYSDVQVVVSVDDQNDQPPLFTVNAQSVRVNEGITDSDLPYSLWTPSYTDNDGISENMLSTYSILNVFNGSTSLGFETSLISINEVTGEVFLTALVDFETTKELTVWISVNNTKIGTGSLCGGFDTTCVLSDISTLNIEITDSNDNSPKFDKSSYSGQISISAESGSRIRQVTATDMDSQNNYGLIRYKLSEGSKFTIEEETGWVVSRGTFENDDGRTFPIKIEAYDNLGNDPSRTSTVEMSILALNGFRRVVILFNRTLSVFTEAKEKLIVDTLHNLTGYTIVVEDIREHLLDNGEVNPSRTDFIFHALDSEGNIVDFNVLIENLNVQVFFDLVADCQPLKISPLQSEEDDPEVETIMLFLIILCGILVFGSIIVLVLACQQRYIALNALWKSRMRDAFYGAQDPSLIDGAVPRELLGESMEMRGRTTTSPLYHEPYFSALDGSGIEASSLGDVDSVQQGNPLYEERELRMDMFELSDDETEGDLDDENLLAKALKDDDDIDGGSVTAI